MKSYRKELWFNVPARMAFVNITPQVEGCLRESGIREGIALVNAMHITASVFINDDEPGLHKDYEEWLEQIAPHEPVSRYRHNRTGEDNGDAHLKRQVMGREVVVAITAGKLDRGRVPKATPRRRGEGAQSCSVLSLPGSPRPMGGELQFGPWEQIFYGEFDGRRKKRALVKIIGE